MTEHQWLMSNENERKDKIEKKFIKTLKKCCKDIRNRVTIGHYESSGRVVTVDGYFIGDYYKCTKCKTNLSNLFLDFIEDIKL